MDLIKPKFRVKVDMSNISVNSCRVWHLIDPETCFTIKSLKKQIVHKFNIACPSRRVEVRVQDFIVPDDESIEVLQPEDILVFRVKSNKLQKLFENSDRNNEDDLILEKSDTSKKCKRIKMKMSEGLLKSRNHEKVDHATSTFESFEKALSKSGDQKFSEKERKPNENQQTKRNIDVIDDINYDELFPLPKKKRIRHRKRKDLTAHLESSSTYSKNQETEKPIVSLDHKPGFDVVGNPVSVRKHLRFTEDDDIVERVGDETNEVIETPAVIEQTNETVENLLGDKDSAVDLSKFKPLIGAPREKDKICYQTLELSENYTPEMSSVRIGEVLSFDSQSNTVAVHLNNPIKTKIRKGKFELIERTSDDVMEENEEEEEEFILIQEESYNLSDMINLKVYVG